ncbi:MAG: hypothetical protein V4625_14825 [Pseudomonadota bacterium]
MLVTMPFLFMAYLTGMLAVSIYPPILSRPWRRGLRFFARCWLSQWLGAHGDKPAAKKL